ATGPATWACEPVPNIERLPPLSGGRRSKFEVRVELTEEVGAPLLLVGLADGARGPAQPVEGAQEAAVALVPPPHVARSSPARLAQAVEAPVVADAVARVGLDVVPGQVTEAGPPLEEPGPPRHDAGHRIAVVPRGGQRVEH